MGQGGTRWSWKRRLLVASVALIALPIGGVLFLAFQEGEYRREPSPDGRYTAIATYRVLDAMVPRFPGQSGDKAGHIRIEGTDGTDYGRMPVPMVSMIYDIRWEMGGAYLVAIGD